MLRAPDGFSKTQLIAAFTEKNVAAFAKTSVSVLVLGPAANNVRNILYVHTRTRQFAQLGAYAATIDNSIRHAKSRLLWNRGGDVTLQPSEMLPAGMVVAMDKGSNSSHINTSHLNTIHARRSRRGPRPCTRIRVPVERQPAPYQRVHVLHPCGAWPRPCTRIRVPVERQPAPYQRVHVLHPCGAWPRGKAQTLHAM